jgi:hypothetical protein
MAIAINGMDGNLWTVRDMDASGSNFITTRHKLAFSGNYTTGGDTLDLSGIAAQIPTNSLPLAVTTTEQGLAATPSLSAAGGFVAVIQGAVPTLKNFLLKVFKNSAGSVADYPNGAYSADVLTDNVFLEITWRKFS